jgi:hypothetical protein
MAASRLDRLLARAASGTPGRTFAFVVDFGAALARGARNKLRPRDSA